MTALITSLEAAEWGSGELNAKIAIFEGWTFRKVKGDGAPYWRKPGVTAGWDRVSVGPPQCTTSLDAAVAFTERLLPMKTGEYLRGDYAIEMFRGFDGRWRVELPRSGGEGDWGYPGHAVATTGPLALVIATLKAWDGGR